MKLPFSTSSRTAIVIANAASGALSRVIGAATAFVMVPVTINYFGAEKYGVLVVILSLSTILQFADFGIGNALIRVSAHTTINNGGPLGGGLIFTSYLIVGGLSLLFWCLSVLIVCNANLKGFFKYTDLIETQVVRDALLAFLTLWALNLPLSLAQQIRLGIQQGYKNGWYLSLGQITNFILVSLGVHVGGGLEMITVASLLGTVVFNLANTIFLFKNMLGRQVRIGCVLQSAKKLINASSGFFVLQLIGLLSYNVDSLIITYFLGPSEVSAYSIALKIYSIPGMLAGFFYSGLWAAYADAERRGEFQWIIHVFKRSLMLGCFFVTLATVPLVFLDTYIFQLLSGGLVNPDYWLVTGMALFAILSAVGGAIASLSNGLNLLKPQIVISSVAVVGNMLLSIILVKSFGLGGPIWGTVISLVFSYPVFTYIILRNLRCRMQQSSTDLSRKVPG